MQYSEFVRRVEERLDRPRLEETESAITATLEVLGESITGEEARDLASQLPKELQAPLTRQPEDAKPYSLEQFFQRVSQKEGVDVPRATAHAAAVMKVLDDAVSEGEIEDVRAWLPGEFDSLLGER